MKRYLPFVLLLLGGALGVPAQPTPTLAAGDVLVTRIRVDEPGFDVRTATIEVLARDGTFKGILAALPGREFSDLFYRDGIIYVAARFPDAIERFDAAGNRLTPLTTAVSNINYLSPGPNGGVLAVNGSGEIYLFAADGSLVHFRDVTATPRGGGGIDLAADGCTVFYAVGDRLVRWDACTNSPATFVTPAGLSGAFGAIRILPDGTFLVGMTSSNRILHLDADGDVLREYPVFGSMLALDIDAASFWRIGCSERIAIATGETISRTCPGGGFGIAVVGEPRAGLPAPADVAAVPLAPPAALLIMAITLIIVAVLRLRIA